MAKQKSKKSYYEKHLKTINSIIEEYKQNIYMKKLFGNSDYSIFRNMEIGVTKHRLRYYQMEGLYMLDSILKTADEKDYKKDLMEVVDKDTGKKAPFIGYEMATGSGKTMLMGASIYFLNKNYGIKNFLIITPPSTDIYQKTIRNFTVGNYESVWAEDTPFSFNLITGDNYTQNLFYDDSHDANIFVFNISKFGANATNTASTWEEAVWKDEAGNSISIKEFLKNEKLVIITDEAHHAQNKKSNQIIKDFHPDLVLEFTATAVENDTSSDKKNQTIAYKYDIKKFLEDGHGKLVRAVALSIEEKSNKDYLTDSEKQKLILLILIHMMKKRAVLRDKTVRGVKPLAFIKVKNDIEFTQKVYDYLTQDLSEDESNIKIILEKLKNPDLEITQLLNTMLENDFNSDFIKIKDEMKDIVKNSISYHSKSGKEVEKKFNEINKNEVEIVVYIQRLDEGIDIPNIYSMAVINDVSNEFKTSVKQIIGRGVRLHKNNREFDDEKNDVLKSNSEKLHIVCDQGKNFEQIIEAIQQEFGLNDKYLSLDKPKEKITNNVKKELLNKKYIPHIRAEYVVKKNTSLIDLVKNIDEIVENYIKNNCYEAPDNPGKYFIKYRPNGFIIEVDVFADEKVYHQQIQQSGGKKSELKIQQKDIDSIYTFACKQLYCLPDNQKIKSYFNQYIESIVEKGLFFYKIDEADEKLAVNNFVNSFSWFYRNHIEKHYYSLNFRNLSDEDTWSLSQSFSNFELKIPKEQIKNKKISQLNGKENEDEIKKLIEGQYNFYGFQKSAYDYDKFDSLTEFQFARYIDEILKLQKENRGNFWIRNQRNIYFSYGSRKYYPDFIVFKDDYIYVFETKGEIYAEEKKIKLLKKLDDVPGIGEIKGYKGILIFSAYMNKIEYDKTNFEDFLKEADEILGSYNKKLEYIENPNDSDKYKLYLPVYDGETAHKKFIKQNKTAKPLGWLLVDEYKYPKSIFLLKVENDDLSPRYEKNKFIFLDSKYSLEKNERNLVLIYNPNIDEKFYEKKCKNPYGTNLALSEFNVVHKKQENKMFGKNILVLKKFHEDIEISEITEKDLSNIIGIEWEK